jgi:hypothetical protein
VLDGPPLHPKSLFGWTGLILLAPIVWLLSEITAALAGALLLRSTGGYRPLARIVLGIVITILIIWSVAHKIATGV